MAEKCGVDSYRQVAGGGSGERNEVLVAGFTFSSTMASLQLAGFDVRVVDTEAGGFNMCPDALAAAVSPRTCAIAVTHFLGFPAQMARLAAVAKEHSLLVLQDACETMDLVAEGKPAHAYGDVSTWSFYHPHHLSSFGGGAVSSPHPEWRRTLESVSHWGRECACHFDKAACEAPPGMNHNFWYTRQGHNLEMSELNACFARFQLTMWPEMEARRKAYYRILLSILQDVEGIATYDMPHDSGSPFVFPITVTKSGFGGQAALMGLSDRLAAVGVEIRSLMGGAITRQPAYARLPTDGLSNCLHIGDRSFFVGIHHTLTEDAVRTVGDIVKQELQR